MLPLLRDPSSLPPDLTARLEALAEALARLEARVARLEGAKAEPDAVSPLEWILPAEAGGETRPEAPGLVSVLALLGQVCLILGGALFLRSLTDAGTLPRGLGVALGVAYALAWNLAAWRARQTLPATFYALASVLITYPLVWESTTTFALFRAPVAALVLLAVSAVHVGVAWIRSLKVVVWFAVLGVLGTAFGLMAATQSLVPFTILFLAFGAGSLWLTYGRRWHALRWPAALSADLSVSVLTVVAAWPGGPPEGYRDLSPRLAMTLALALVVIYLGSFAARMLQRRRTLNAFELLQTILVLLAGFGGSLRVALVSGSGAGLLGLSVLVAGAGCYAAASPFAGDREDLRANFSFFTSLALVFLLLGGPIVLPAIPFGLAAGLLGLVSILLGLRLRRTILLLQGAVALTATTLASGFLAWTWAAYLGAPGALRPPTGPALATLACLLAAHALLVARRPAEPLGWRLRLPSLLLGASGVLGAGAGLLWLGAQALGPGPADPGQVAALRTGVLSAAAIALAALGRRAPGSELGWLVYPLLGLAAVKFLLEDLSVGRPLTLFPAFMVFGAALILAPRFLKAARAAGTPEGDPGSRP